MAVTLFLKWYRPARRRARLSVRYTTNPGARDVVLRGRSGRLVRYVDMLNRRDFLTSSTAALAGLLPKVALGQMRLEPRSVRWGTGLEPLVRVIEETP